MNEQTNETHVAGFDADQMARLRAPLDGSKVKTRPQGGRDVSYIEGWVAIAEANDIFGFDAWDHLLTDLHVTCERPTRIGKPPNEKEGWEVGYRATVMIVVRTPGGRVIKKDDVGSGTGIDRDLVAAHESAMKEAVTDAMKRALRHFGNPFGLALYDKEQRNVARGAKRPTQTATGPATNGVPAQATTTGPRPGNEDGDRGPTEKQAAMIDTLFEKRLKIPKADRETRKHVVEIVLERKVTKQAPFTQADASRMIARLGRLERSDFAFLVARDNPGVNPAEQEREPRERDTSFLEPDAAPASNMRDAAVKLLMAKATALGMRTAENGTVLMLDEAASAAMGGAEDINPTFLPNQLFNDLLTHIDARSNLVAQKG